MATVSVDWEIARDARFRQIAQKGSALARPSSGTASTSKSPASSRGASIWYRFRAGNEVSQVGRTKTAPPAGAAVDRLRFRRSAAAATTRPATSRRFGGSLKSSSTSFSTPATTSTRGAPTADGTTRASASTTATRSTRSSTIATATRSTRSDPDLMAAHASAPFVDQLGRPRGREQLRRRSRRERHAAGDLPAAARRAYQAYYETMPLRPARCRPAAYADLSPAAVRQPDRFQRPRHAPVAIGSGVQRRVHTIARRRSIRRGR